MPENVTCILCGPGNHRFLFSKESAEGELFNLVQCLQCGLQFVSPRPGPGEIGRYYSGRYFTTRTCRGYNNYFSREIRTEIERVIALNLKDLDFFRYEKLVTKPSRSLDIGCAAGYFVNFLNKRGWAAEGIDISNECVSFARDELGLSVWAGDYLDTDFHFPFDLITLWATVEHLHYPHLFLEKIYRDLAPGGMLYISTCRTGGINFMKLFGSKWRYYNFPEHLYFFSYSTMKKLLENCGFQLLKYKTYGSGFGKTGGILRKMADFIAKKLYMGDMMIISARKN